MTENSLKQTLEECRNSASAGYKIASSQYKNLNTTLAKASETIRDTLIAFNNSPCYLSSSTELLEQQLIETQEAFNELSFAFKEDLENLKENISKFSITLFGRTMAGKSTLMEILTEGNGESIGKGAQRTTRDVRKYTWNDLEITDVPGIGAFEGEDDEQIAFEAAKKADLILFLITDDAPQAAEADCFSRIVNLGKPVFCIMNVKASMPEGKSIKLVIRDIEKRFDPERLNDIKNQFLSYASNIGQDWGHIPFINVHLKSAFSALRNDDSSISETLYKVSRIDYLKKRIIALVQDKGNYYREKTFIDIIANPMLDSMERLIHQSLLNGTQGRTVLSKKRQLVAWKESYVTASENQIRSLIIKIKSELNSEIAGFAEEHFSDRQAEEAWNKLLKERKIQDECQNLLQSIEEQCNDKINEISREITNELNFTASFTNDSALRMNKIIDGKRMWDWSATILGGGLSIGAIIAGACGAAAAGPLGWAAIAVTVVGLIGSFFFHSRDKKEHEARMKLEEALKKNVNSICSSLEKQMLNCFGTLVRKRIDSLLNELDRMNSVVFRLADTQKELAWELDNHLLVLNKQIVCEAIKLIGAEGLEYHIKGVARIPGNTITIMLNDGDYFPPEQKALLQKLMSESISFIYSSENKCILISRVIGKSIDRNRIRIEEKIGVAHIPITGSSPYVVMRVRMAQQFAQIAITE